MSQAKHIGKYKARSGSEPWH